MIATINEHRHSLLSSEAKAVVEATAAVVAEHADEITGRFYPAMLTAHPDLQRLFNKGNQATGEQSRALAASVVAYAVQLIDPTAPSFEHVMKRIAYKHISLGIRPEPQRPVIVAHADRTAQDHALRETVLHVGRQLDDFTAYSWYETVEPDNSRSRRGFMDLSQLPLPDDIQVFTCGPLPFMRHVRSTLLKRGIPATRIRYEVFGPDLWAAQIPAEPVEA